MKINNECPQSVPKSVPNAGQKLGTLGDTSAVVHRSESVPKCVCVYKAHTLGTPPARGDARPSARYLELPYWQRYWFMQVNREWTAIEVETRINTDGKL